MLISTLIILSLLSLSSAATLPASVAVTITTIISTTIASSPPTTTTSLTPFQHKQQAVRFAADYASLIKAQSTNPNFIALQTDRSDFARQESAYILALETATGEIPQPAYVTALPVEQQSYLSSLHASLASIAKVDYGLAGSSSSSSVSSDAAATPAAALRNGTMPVNGTIVAGGNSTTASNVTVVLSTTATPPAGTGPPANSTNSSKNLAVGRQPAGLVKMVGAGLIGVMGIAAFL
ncbi:MAG: hypothetical protein Q9202_002282 [Teloschistes flavicans]